MPEPLTTAPTVGDLFADVAARHAQRPAIQTDETQWTYAELDARASRIAARLEHLARHSPPHVALLIAPSPEAIATILGALRAGVVYVPLDAADPPGRLNLIVNDAEARAIVTRTDLLPLARELAPAGCDVIDLDDTSAGEERDLAIGPSAEADGDRPAYMLYTSGSTGRPKGVLQTHANLMHFIRSYGTTLGITPEDRLSLLYSMSFSAANMDIYGALLTGATLCPYDVRRRGTAGIAAWIARRHITVLHTVPTLYRHILDSAPSAADLASVRAVDLGGEPVYSRDVELARGRLRDDCVIVNHYAATEASVIAQHGVHVGADTAPGLLAVGRPADGIEIRILGEDGHTVVDGAAGFVAVESPHLSPGYWQLPELTTATFTAGARPGWRRYRTGDRGRIDADGRLHVLGRADARVKVRGYTVDLLEVEAACRLMTGVSDAVVVAVTDTADVAASSHRPQAIEPVAESKLVAYLVAEKPSGAAARRALSTRVPAYMVPAEIRFLSALPLTATGKVDRKTLAGADRPASIEVADAPGELDGPLEREVAQIVQRVLQIPRAGRADSFFDLGGDSLKLAALQTDLRRSLGRELPMSALHEDATVAGIARALRADGLYEASREWPVIVPLRASGTGPPLFLVHGIDGQALVSPAFLRALGDDTPVYAFQARGLTGDTRPHQRIAEMAADYNAAMRSIQPEGPYLLASICAGGVVAHEMACQLARAQQSLALLLLIDPQVPRHTRRWARRVRFVVDALLSRLPAIGRARERYLAHLATHVRRRGEQGRSAYTTMEPARIDAAVRVAAEMRLALLRHRMDRYAGDVEVLASASRLEKASWRTGRWRKAFLGTMTFTPVAERHALVLDPQNALFAAELGRVVGTARARLSHFNAATAPRESATSSR